jgi:hypothetical protein
MRDCARLSHDDLSDGFANRFEPQVTSICPEGNGGNVTLKLTPGFSFGKPVLYLRYVPTAVFQFSWQRQECFWIVAVGNGLPMYSV